MFCFVLIILVICVVIKEGLLLWFFSVWLSCWMVLLLSEVLVVCGVK